MLMFMRMNVELKKYWIVAVRVRMGVFVFMLRGVFAFLRMLMTVFMFIFMLVLMGILEVNIEFRSLDLKPFRARCVQVIAADRQFRQLALKMFERHPEIEHRAQKHIAADAAENIEEKCFHQSELIWLAA